MLTVEQRLMTPERIDVEIAKLEVIKEKKWFLHEDQKYRLDVLREVRTWLADDAEWQKQEKVRLAAEEELRKQLEYENDPNRKTKDVFDSYRGKISKERGMR